MIRARSSYNHSIATHVFGLALAAAPMGCAADVDQTSDISQSLVASYTPDLDTWAQRTVAGHVDWGTSRELRTNNIDVAVAPPQTILLHFPINLALVCPTFTGARLTLHSADLIGPLQVYVHPITSPWGPGPTGMLPPAADCSASSGAASPFAHPTFLPPSATRLVNDNCIRFTWDVTAIVTGWCANPATHFGFLVAGRDPAGPVGPVNFFSMEAAPGRQPVLDISY